MDLPFPRTVLADQRAAAVALACISDSVAAPALCTRHAGIDLTARIPELTIASTVADDAHLGLLESLCLRTACCQSAPSSDPAPGTRGNITAPGQACWITRWGTLAAG